MALVCGGAAQFVGGGGTASQVVYRFGRVPRFPPSRLDRAGARVAKAGPIGVGVAVLTPGVRAVAVIACGLVNVPTATFLVGLVLGSTAFLCLHFALGYAGTAALASVASVASPWLL